MAVTHFKNFEMLDPEAGELRGGHELVVEGEKIREVSAKPIKLAEADVVDCGGRTLMPGLIDSHVHVVLSEVVIRNMESVPLTLMTARAAELMRGMLDRGFTTVRDTGGADWGLKEATEKGLLPGPRLFIAGRAIGPTGGHSDGRRRTDFGTRCHCCNALAFSMGVADGVAEVRRAVREEMRQGCDQVKIMMSGGVASPYDPLDSLQFSVGEVEAAVEEAHAFGRYVCAHAYTPEAITRAAHAGVRTIEHGNLIDDASAKLMAEKGMFLVANLVTYYEMKKRAAEYGMSSDMLAKNDLVIDGALKSLEICKRHGVPVGLRHRPARPAAGRAVGGVHAARRGAVAGRDHPLGDDDRRADRAHGGQARLPEAGRVRRSAGGRRQSAEGPEAAAGAGPAPLGDHEGRPVSQEQAALSHVDAATDPVQEFRIAGAVVRRAARRLSSS